jgi:hypothetical protein
VVTLSFMVEMLNFLSQVTLQALGFLVPIVFAQRMNAPLLLVYPVLEFMSFPVAVTMLVVMVVVIAVVAFPLFVYVAHSFFHDSFGFPFQFPCFLVFAGFGQVLDFASTLLHPVLEPLFAVMLTLDTAISAFTFVMVFAIAFPWFCFLGPNPTHLATQLLGLFVFALLLQGLDLAAFLVNPFAKLAVVFFDSLMIAFPSFSFFSDKVVGC